MTTTNQIYHLLAQTNKQLSPSLAKTVTYAIINHMAQGLIENGRIEIRGFGSFAVRTYPPRMVRNPKTGKSHQIQTPCKVYFRASRNLLACDK